MLIILQVNHKNKTCWLGREKKLFSVNFEEFYSQILLSSSKSNTSKNTCFTEKKLYADGSTYMYVEEEEMASNNSVEISAVMRFFNM